MGTQFGRGFTIVETMLFLAISGVLIVTMVAATGAQVNIQRYRDAVETFKTTLQDQYGELSSVRNERDDTWGCNAAAQSQSGGNVARGQSTDCILLGRYLEVEDGAISIYSVLGAGENTASTGNDISRLLNDYTLNVSTVSEETTEMEWGTKLAWPSIGTGSGTSTPRNLAVLFLRSPHSGQIYTFTSDTVPTAPSPASLATMVVGGESVPGQRERVICIDSDGLFVNSNLSVYINSYATGPSSVESLSNDVIQSTTSAVKDKGIQC